MLWILDFDHCSPPFFDTLVLRVSQFEHQRYKKQKPHSSFQEVGFLHFNLLFNSEP